MIDAVTRGRPGTAMMAFDRTLTAEEIRAVVAFVRDEFMLRAARNTRYHTAENGWPDHDRYRAAFPFALYEVPLDTPWESLSDELRAGKRMFLESCVSCHDRGQRNSGSAIWEARPLSYPRQGFSFSETIADATSGATPYAVHDKAPVLKSPTPKVLRGEQLFQKNCAFCHAADGTGKNWIGSFLEPHPRDLTGERVATLTDAQLTDVVRNGIPGTTMSAWRSVLSEEEIAAIVAYVRAAFVAPRHRSASN